jgi:hypothetical protein
MCPFAGRGRTGEGNVPLSKEEGKVSDGGPNTFKSLPTVTKRFRVLLARQTTRNSGRSLSLQPGISQQQVLS